MTPTQIKQMLDRPGLYFVMSEGTSDGEVPILSIGGKLYAMEVDQELDPTRFTEAAVFAGGPYRATPEMAPKIEITAPTISIDRSARSIGILNNFRTIRPFRTYTDEDEALQEAREWLQQYTAIEPRVVYPELTAIRAVRRRK